MFVLGYGLHLADLYRNLPVRRARPTATVVHERPGGLRGGLYGRRRRSAALGDGRPVVG